MLRVAKSPTARPAVGPQFVDWKNHKCLVGGGLSPSAEQTAGHHGAPVVRDHRRLMNIMRPVSPPQMLERANPMAVSVACIAKLQAWHFQTTQNGHHNPGDGPNSRCHGGPFDPSRAGASAALQSSRTSRPAAVTFKSRSGEQPGVCRRPPMASRLRRNGHSPSTRRVCSVRISSATLVRESRTSSANGAFGRHERQDNAGMRLVTAASR